MAERIIYRGRPRINDPFPFIVEADAVPEGDGYFYLGPLTLDQLMELEFRVKKFSVSGSVTYEKSPTEEDPTTSRTSSFAYDIEKGRIQTNSISEYEGIKFTKESDFTGYFIDGNYGFNTGRFCFIKADEPAGIWPPTFFPIVLKPYKINDQYYVAVQMSLYQYDDILGDYISISESPEGQDSELKIGDKTYNIKISGYAGAENVLSVTFAMEASEWWPYANADEQPIWNTATGTRTSNPFS